MAEKRTICMYAECSDMFWAQLEDENGKNIGEYNGYVPDFFPGEHYGDYVQLDIDVETGQILNWNKPTKKDLEIFKTEEPT